MFRFPVLFSMLPVCRVWRFWSLLVAWLLCVGVLQAQTVYGDCKLVGTGADAGVSFEFPASLLCTQTLDEWRPLPVPNSRSITLFARPASDPPRQRAEPGCNRP